MQNEKQCYSYYPETLLFNGIEWADKNPFDETYILPANTTFTPPEYFPKDNKHLLKFDVEDDSWVLIPNKSYVDEAKSLRRNAYRENSDDLFMKAVRLRSMGRLSEAIEVEEEALRVVMCIKNVYSYN